MGLTSLLPHVSNLRKRLLCTSMVWTGTTLGLYFIHLFMYGTAVVQWLRCCATNREIAGSIPCSVIGIFH